MEDDRNAPATKGDIAETRQEIKAMEDRLVESFRDGQTELLKAFYNFAESNTKRVAQNEVNEAANRSRIETLSGGSPNSNNGSITHPPLKS